MEAFIAHAAWSRARPGFDEEERDYKLELANRLVEVMEAAREGADLGKQVSGALDAFVDVLDSRIYSLTAPGDNERLRAWAAADPESLRAAMRAFLDPGLSPVERVESLAAEAAGVRRRAGLELGPGSVLAIGSLLNFAVAPASCRSCASRCWTGSSRYWASRRRGGPRRLSTHTTSHSPSG